MIPGFGIVYHEIFYKVWRKRVRVRMGIIDRFEGRDGRDPRVIPNSNVRIHRNRETSTFKNQRF